MQADVLLDFEALPIDQTQKVHLMARFVSGAAPEDSVRRPLNLCLVIDRSGSMGGAKLDYTRQAAQFLVQNLSVRDTLSIVLYNDHVETLLLPEKVQRKDVINQKINGIKARGTTNLSSGWLEGCNLVAQNMDYEAVNRVILMSDGLANRGVTNSIKLVTMAQQKFAENISTTTMGLGNDFNEDLLMDMSTAGGGAFYFIESPEVAPLIFQEELQGLLSVVGQNLTITVHNSDHVSSVKQLNAYPMQSDIHQTSFRLGDIYGNEVKALVIELDLKAFSEVGKKQIATLVFEYDELHESGAERKVIEVPVNINVHLPDEQSLPANKEVEQSVLLLTAAQARREAIRAADHGEFKTAAQSLRQAADAIENSMITDPKLIEEQSALRQQATELEQGASRYNEYNRKTMSTQAFYTMTSRHDDTVMLRVREQERGTSSDKAGEPIQMPPPDLPEEKKPRSPRPEIVVEKQDGVMPTHVSWNDRTFELQGDLIRMGRSQHNEIVIGASGVSRFHCQIRRVGSHLLLEDLGSTNGTMYKGKLLTQPQILSIGDVAYMCDEKLVFHDGSHLLHD